MNLTREIHTLEAELRGPRRDIPCALAGRNVCDAECCARVLAADASGYRTCRACHRGQQLARSSGLPVRNLPMLAELPAWARPAHVESRHGKPALPELSARPAATPRPKRLAKRPAGLAPAPAAAPQTAPVPASPHSLAPRLAELARVLRELTADGRMRVSMLDLMHGLRAAHYDEAGALVQAAGLHTSRLYGPVEAVIIDYRAQQLLARAAASEVRQ